MATSVLCNYGDCRSPATLACNCSPDPALLCERHTSNHVEGLPDKAHTFQKPYLPLQPQEQEAFISAKALLSDTEKAKKEALITEHSRKSGKILKELKETTSKLLRQLKDTNQTHLNSLKELNKNMTQMRAALSEVGTLGVPTFRTDGFSARLGALKKDKQVFTSPQIVKEINNYWQQQGITTLIQVQDRPTPQRVQLTDKLQFKKIREHKIKADCLSNISFSLDGRYYAAGSDDKTIKIWNAANGELIHSLEGHTDKVHSVSFSPDSESLASGSKDTTIGLWTLLNGKATIKQLKGHLDEVNSVVFSNNRELIASGSSDQTVGTEGLTPRTFRCSLFSVFLAR